MYSRTENSTLVTVSMVSTALGDGRWSTEGESECLAALDCGWAAACTASQGCGGGGGIIYCLYLLPTPATARSRHVWSFCLYLGYTLWRFQHALHGHEEIDKPQIKVEGRQDFRQKKIMHCKI